MHHPNLLNFNHVDRLEIDTHQIGSLQVQTKVGGDVVTVIYQVKYVM